MTAVESHQWIILRTPWDVSVHNKKKKEGVFFFLFERLEDILSFIYIHIWMDVYRCVCIYNMDLPWSYTVFCVCMALKNGLFCSLDMRTCFYMNLSQCHCRLAVGSRPSVQVILL